MLLTPDQIKLLATLPTAVASLRQSPPVSADASHGPLASVSYQATGVDPFNGLGSTMAPTTGSSTSGVAHVASSFSTSSAPSHTSLSLSMEDEQAYVSAMRPLVFGSTSFKVKSAAQPEQGDGRDSHNDDDDDDDDEDDDDGAAEYDHSFRSLIASSRGSREKASRA